MIRGLNRSTSSYIYIYIYSCLRFLIPLSIIFLIILQYLLINPLAFKTHNSFAVSTDGIPQDSTVTLSLDLEQSNALVSLLPKNDTGTFSSSSESQSAKFNVSTDNYTGYTLSISSSVDTGLLTNTDTSITTNNTLSSIESATSESDFSSSSSTSLNNKWGYKPSHYNSTTNTNYLPSPTTTPSILNATEVSNNNTPDEYTIGLGARVDYTRATGTYTNTFILNAIGNPVPVTLTYTDTSEDSTVSNLPTKYEGAVSETRVEISQTIPARTGYTFKSWCLGEVTAGTSENNYVDTCTGTTYNPSTAQNIQYIGVDLTHSNTMTLVAMWERNKYTQTVQVKYQGTDGNYGAYSTYAACTADVYYGDTHSCSIAATTEYQAASVASYTVTEATTKNMDVARQTYRQTIQARYQNTNGGWGNYGDYSSCTKDVYYGATHSCSIAATTEYKAASVASYTVTSANTKQMDVARQTYTQTIQIRYQNASGGWGSYSNYSSCTKAVYYGASHSCSVAADTTYAATSVASYTVTGANTKQMSASRNTRTVSLSKGTGVSAVTVTGTGVKSGSGTASATAYYGGAVTITATMSSGYDWVNWTGSATYTNRAQSISSVTSNLSFTANGKASCQSSISGTMQTFDPSKLCSNVTSGTLTDARGDNQTYQVAKLADGKWWMLENLRLGGTSTIALTSSNTNMTASSWTLPAGITSGMNVYNSAKLNVASKNTTQPLAVGQSGTGKIGVYYNYCAATVRTYCYAFGAGTADASKDNDICPKKWRMPTGGASGEYQALRNKYSSDGAFAAALKTPLSGRFDDYSANYQGTLGDFWSSTRYDGGLMYVLYVNTSRVIPQTYRDRGYGLSVRCLFK